MRVEKILIGLLVVAVSLCWLLSILPALMPYIVALFVMAAALRTLWFFTRGW